MSYWARTIDLTDIWENKGLDPFEDHRDAVVKRFRESAWLIDAGIYDEITELIDDLGDSREHNEFDSVLSRIYDEADADHVWIATEHY